MHTYEIIVTRSGDWIMVDIPAIGQVTQADNPDEVERNARECIAVTTGEPIDSIEVVPSPDSVV
jgi:predicted RNase H-like HicB family nuclease